MSEMTRDYLANVEVHQFSEEMSIFESAMETCLLAESNWAYIVESTALNEYNTYEAAINRGELVEDAFREADEANSGNFVDKVKASFKKIGSFFYGLFAKFINGIRSFFGKNNFLVSPDAVKREEAGLKKLGNNVQIEGFMINQNIISTIENSYKSACEFIKSTIKPVDNFGDTVRGKIVGTNSVASDEFKSKLMDKIGESKTYTINSGTLKIAQSNFSTAKVYSAAAKGLFEESKTAINNCINTIDATNKSIDRNAMSSTSDNLAALAKLYHEGVGILAKANGIILSALNADYTTCAKILLKCYNAGGGKEQQQNNESDKNKKAVNDAASFTTESIESIFGSPVFQ